MAVVVVSIEPYAIENWLLPELAQVLDLDFVDLRPFEQDLAERIDLEGFDDVALLAPRSAAHEQWRMRKTDLNARVSELTIETAARGNVLIAGWSAAAVLAPLPHVATAFVHASRNYRAVAVQRRLRYPHFGTALLELANADSLVDKLVRDIFRADWRAPGHYGLTLDAEQLSASDCIRLIQNFTGDGRFDECPATEQMVSLHLEKLLRQ